MMAGFVYGLRTMPLSTAYAITFVAPLLVTAMAGPLLKERVGAGRWIAIVIGLVGVLVILRPTGEGMLTGGGLAESLEDEYEAHLGENVTPLRRRGRRALRQLGDSSEPRVSKTS